MRAACSLAIACALIAHAGSASANPADDAFKRGRDLLKAKKWAEACAAFEESQKLDPQLGTKFNIAQCDEHIGKLATALAIYRELAATDANEQRKATSAELAAALAPRVPKLRIDAPAAAAVTVDGVACAPASCDRAAVLVDLGEHVVEIDGVRATATVRAEGELVPVAKPEPVVKAPIVWNDIHVGPARSRPPYGMITTAAGGAVLVAGLVFGLRARSAYADAKDICGGMTTCPSDDDTARANALAATARSRGNVATALVAGGAVVAAAGVVLWLTVPRVVSEHVTATASPSSAEVAVGFAF